RKTPRRPPSASKAWGTTETSIGPGKPTRRWKRPSHGSRLLSQRCWRSGEDRGFTRPGVTQRTPGDNLSRPGMTRFRACRACRTIGFGGRFSRARDWQHLDRRFLLFRLLVLALTFPVVRLRTEVETIGRGVTGCVEGVDLAGIRGKDLERLRGF